MKRIILLCLLLAGQVADAQKTQKPVLHGRHWMAITGKPLAATAGATISNRAAMPLMLPVR